MIIDEEIDFYLRLHLHNISGSITKKGNKGTQDFQSLEQKLTPIPLLKLTEVWCNFILLFYSFKKLGILDGLMETI